MGTATPLPNTRLEEARLLREEGALSASLCLARPDFSLLASRRVEFLHPEEEAFFTSCKFERRQGSYLVGRYCAKLALNKLCPKTDPVAFAIRPGVFTQPVVQPSLAGVQVSISHAGGWGAALAFPEAHPMGIDIEEINPERSEVIRSQATPAEIRLLAASGLEESKALALLWTMKEALSKTLRCGMMTPFSIFEINSLGPDGGRFSAEFTNFAQYKAVSFFHENLAVSLACPRRTTLEFSLGKNSHA